jgi:hypothetical protein
MIHGNSYTRLNIPLELHDFQTSARKRRRPVDIQSLANGRAQRKLRPLGHMNGLWNIVHNIRCIKAPLASSLSHGGRGIGKP